MIQGAWASTFTPFPPMEPMKPMKFKPFKNPNHYPEGISYECEKADGEYLLIKNEKKTSTNGHQFQSQSIASFEYEQECLPQKDELNDHPQNEEPTSGSFQQQTQR
jgi:hypothetical protein